VANHTLTLELFYDGVWNAAPIYQRAGFNLKRGTSSVGNDTDPASATVTIDNRSGDYSPRSLASSLAGKIGQNTRARFTIDSDVQLVGEVASWKPYRVKGDAWTEIEVAGVLQRIGRGTDPIDSALRRYIEADGPIGYWPMEDDSRQSNFGSVGLDQVADNAQPEWGVFDGPPGSRKTPKFFVNDDRPPSVQTTHEAAGTLQDWTVSVWFRAYPGPESSFFSVPVVDFMEIEVAGGTSVRYWTLEALSNPSADQYEVSAYTLDESRSFSTPFIALTHSGVNVHDGKWHMITLNVYDTGGGTHVDLTIDDLVDAQVSASDLFTNGTHLRTYLPKRIDPANIQDLSLAHLAVWDFGGYSNPDIIGRYNAGMGHPNELAADRFNRLCNEEGIAPTVIGDPDESIVMGPQLPTTLLSQFNEIARTDDASVFETKDSIGLTMRTGASKLNQTPALSISYIAQIMPPLVPVFGDEGIRNDVTASAPTGGQVRVQQLTGPHNVELPQDDPQGVGRYQTRIDVNPATSDALRDAAGWRVHQGTFDGTWYAAITADLDAAPSLTATVAALDIGDVIELTDLPVDEALDAVQALIIGIEQDMPDKKRRTVTFFCVPADPYRVGLLAETLGDTDPFVGHLETDDSTTVGSTAPGATSFTVATNSGPRWITDSDDFPFDVIVGGQRVSITSIAGASSPQTFNVDPLGHQVVYTIPAGSAVVVQQPIILSM
jgi:hypothetical protein